VAKQSQALFKLICAGLLALALGVALPVYAHAVIEKAEPPVGGAVAAAPAQVHVWFTEPIAPGFYRLSVYPAGSDAPVDLGDSRLEGDRVLTVSLPAHLPDGSYTVQWQAFTQSDGHTTSGTYSFGVGVPADPAQTVAARGSPVADASRLLSLGGQLLFAGVIMFRWAIRLDDERRFRRRLFWAAQVARAALVLGLLAALYQQMRVLDAPLLTTVLGTQWGAVWLARAALVGFVAVGIHRLMRGESRSAAALAGGLLLLTTSVTSHSAARFGAAGVAADWVHVLAASVWSGGALCAAVALADGERKFLADFSILASAAVGALAVTGLWLGREQVGSWAALLLTDYGRALLIKLAVAAVAFGLGAVNALRPSRQLVTLEAALGLGVIACAAVLTNLPPAVGQIPSGAPTRLERIGSVADAQAQLSLWPARQGVNTMQARLTDAAGAPMAGAQVSAQFFPRSAEAVVSELPLAEVGGGVYSATGANFTAEGSWEVLLKINTADYLNFDFSIGPDGAVRSAGEPLSATVRAVGWLNRYAGALAAGALLALAAGWSWLAWRSLPRSRITVALWVVPGLLFAGAIWLWILLTF
jgi:copper transport protein